MRIVPNRTAKTSPSITIDPEACRKDHLRVAPAIARDCGPAALILAAIYRKFGDGTCFLSHDAIAKLAECSRITIDRALSRRGPLVENGWLEYLGREQSSAKRGKRRTVSVKLTTKALEALEGPKKKRHFLMIPQVMLREGRWTFTWSELLVAGELVSRSLLGQKQDAFDRDLKDLGRDLADLDELQRATGLDRRSIKTALTKLVSKEIAMGVEDNPGYFKLAVDHEGILEDTKVMEESDKGDGGVPTKVMEEFDKIDGRIESTLFDSTPRESTPIGNHPFPGVDCLMVTEKLIEPAQPKRKWHRYPTTEELASTAKVMDWLASKHPDRRASERECIQVLAAASASKSQGVFRSIIQGRLPGAVTARHVERGTSRWPSFPRP